MEWHAKERPDTVCASQLHHIWPACGRGISTELETKASRGRAARFDHGFDNELIAVHTVGRFAWFALARGTTMGATQLPV